MFQEISEGDRSEESGAWIALGVSSTEKAGLGETVSKLDGWRQKRGIDGREQGRHSRESAAAGR